MPRVSAFAEPVDLSGLRDRVALITGGASGLGRATCFQLAEAGVEVVVADVDTEGGQAVAADVGGHFVECDVRTLAANEAAVQFCTERCGGLDLVYLNAGVATGCGMGDDFDEARYRRAMAINLDGVVFGAQAAFSALRARGGGAMVATASLAGLLAMPLDPIYAANKHAVVGLVRALGPVFAGAGIRVNAVCPGFAESAIIAEARADLVAAGFDIIPAETVAETVVRLFADGSVNGECWFVQPWREPEPFRFRNVPGPGPRPQTSPDDTKFDVKSDDRP
jgi:NAD(P)-dependent dehydrogenase (short-subunit alcohol dehydrogenase family)